MAIRAHAHASPEIPEAIAAPGLIIRTQASLGEQERMIQFEGFVDRDASLSEINHLCDKITQASNRQRARHVLPAMRRQLADLEYWNAENKARLAELNAREKAMDEARADKALELRQRRGVDVEVARQTHYASGRKGDFKAPAAVTSRIDAQIEELAANQAREHADNEVTRNTLKGEIKDGPKGDREIAKQRAIIAEYEEWAQDAQ